MKSKFSSGILALGLLVFSASGQEDPVLELGRLTYQSCVACHGPDGKGIRAGDLLMAPSLHDSDFIKEEHPDLLTAIILKGILKEKNDYVQAMLALEAALNDKQIAALIAYTTKEFGGKRQSPTANDVAGWRQKFADRTTPWKRSEMEEELKAASEPRLLSNLTYKLYKGKWEELPDFSQLTPIEEGKLEDNLITLAPASKIKEPFGMVFEGTLTFDTSGKVNFSITSDDGSALALDGETLVGNDGIHPAKTARMPYEAEAGTHTYKLLYFDGGGQRFLSAGIRMGKETIWLSETRGDGKQKGKPSYDPIPLTARQPDEAIVHRAFLPDAGPRAIAVGYPAKVNLVWDADVLNLAYVYRGDFMDVSPHWNGRGSGSTPLGSDRVKIVLGYPLQVLESLDEPWAPLPVTEIKYERDTAQPEKFISFHDKNRDFQFLGYRLDELRYPSFRYRFQDLAVTDRAEPELVDGVMSVSRTIQFEGEARENLYFRIATTGSQEKSGDWIDIGQGLSVRVSGAETVTRQVEGNPETVAPVASDSTLT
ncbi:MAG: PA14 domain-containing protein, partial [Verrucomicrobiota bacterium]